MESIYDLPEFLLIGKWRLVDLWVNRDGRGWHLLEEYEDVSITWQFISPRGSIEGKFLERINGEEDFLTGYVYYPEKLEFRIDLSDYDDDPFRGSYYINDSYRIEPISRDELWLYDLKDVVREPQDYRLRRKIKRTAR